MRGKFLVCVLYGFVGSSFGALPKDAVNAVVERYGHLVLALGQHDLDYVDSFYGPAEWKTQAEKGKKSLDAIGAEAAELGATLTKTPDSATEFLESSFYCSSNSSTHPGAQGAHDLPFVSTLLEEIHENKLTANVFSILKPLFGHAGLDYGHIAEHLHVHRSVFKRQEFVLAGFKIA